MKKTHVIGLLVLLVAGYILGRYFPNTQKEIVESEAIENLEVENHQSNDLDTSPQFLETNSSSTPEVEDLKLKAMREKFKAADMSEKKIQAMVGLHDFYKNSPTFNTENIQKRQRLFDVLNETPTETAESFRKLITSSPEDDHLRSFILNHGMLLNLSNEDKASLVVTRAAQGAKYRADGTVEDNELSLMIGMGHLSRIKSVEVKNKAIDELISQAKDNENFKQIIRDYFPEYKDKI